MVREGAHGNEGQMGADAMSNSRWPTQQEREAATPPHLLADHIHHQTLDNRRSELRSVTPTENIENRKDKSKPRYGHGPGVRPITIGAGR